MIVHDDALATIKSVPIVLHERRSVNTDETHVAAAFANLRAALRWIPEVVHCGDVRDENGQETADVVVRRGFDFLPIVVRGKADGKAYAVEFRGWPLFARAKATFSYERADDGIAVIVETELWPRGIGRLHGLRAVVARREARQLRARIDRMAGELSSMTAPAHVADTWTIGASGHPSPAGIYRQAGALAMRAKGNGHAEVPMTGDAATYLDRPPTPRAPCPDRLFVPELPTDATDIFLDVTRRCNLRCHACFASANESEDADPALGDVLAVLGRVKTRPLVSIKGGEPTVRRELPDFIREIRRLGFPLKVNTNGLKFADPSYARAIRDAGCDTVCLQWDGEDEDVIVALRGRALLGVKRTALDNLARNGFHVILAFMLVENQTGRHVREVIDFALRRPNISLVGILPVSRIGRNEFGGCGETLSMADAFQLIERDFAPKLLYEDFRVGQRLASRVSSIVGGAKFRALSCCLGQFLLHRDGDIVPATRLLSPREWRGRPWLARAAMALAWRVVTGRLTHAHPNLLGLVVEKFMDGDGFDLAEAMACRKYYLAPGGFISPCVYNTIAAG